MIIIISFSLDCRMIFWHTSWNVCWTPLSVCNSTYYTSYILHLILYFVQYYMLAGLLCLSLICELYCLFISYIHLVLYFASDVVFYSIFSIICNWDSMMSNNYHLNKIMMNDYCSPMQVAPFTLPSASLNPWKRKRQHQIVFSHYVSLCCFKLKRNIVESSIFCASCRKRR